MATGWPQKPPLGVPLDPEWVQRMGCVGFWAFSESGGTLVNNLSGNRNTGTITGATWARGQFGPCLSFDGDNDYVDCGKSPAGGLSAITVQARVKPVSVATQMIIEDGNGYTANAFYFNLSTGKPDLEICESLGGYDLITATTAIPTTEWTDLALVWQSGTRIKMFVNGQEKTGTRDGSLQTGKLLVGNKNLTVGGRPTLTLDYSGLVDGVQIYNRALPAADIQRLCSQPFYMFQRQRIELWTAILGEEAPTVKPYYYYAQAG